MARLAIRGHALITITDGEGDYWYECFCGQEYKATSRSKARSEHRWHLMDVEYQNRETLHGP